MPEPASPSAIQPGLVPLATSLVLLRSLLYGMTYPIVVNLGRNRPRPPACAREGADPVKHSSAHEGASFKAITSHRIQLCTQRAPVGGGPQHRHDPCPPRTSGHPRRGTDEASGHPALNPEPDLGRRAEGRQVRT